MLSRPDSRVARRDTALPGLACLLDSESVLHTFRQAAPHLDLRKLRVDYLRYKPGVNCLARLAVDLAGTSTFAYAKAFASGHLAPTLRPRDLAFLAVRPGIEFALFPFDRKLPSLPYATSPAWAADRTPGRAPETSCPGLPAIETLAYKPERRFVARWQLDDGRCWLAKTYRPTDFPAVRERARWSKSFPHLPLPVLASVRERRHTLLFRWVEGRPLSPTLTQPTPDLRDVAQVGSALARLHREPPPDLGPCSAPPLHGPRLPTVRHALSLLLPDLEESLGELCRNLASRWSPSPTPRRICHGDFHAGQVVLTVDGPAFLDLDEAHAGDSIQDLASFLAQLERESLLGLLPSPRREALAEAFLEGYQSVLPLPPAARLATHVADHLAAEAALFFRLRHPEWDSLARSAIDRARELAHPSSRTTSPEPDVHLPENTAHGVSSFPPAPVAPAPDPELPNLARAQDPATVTRLVLPELARGLGLRDPRLVAVHLHRHKPGRRALLEYSVATEGSDALAVIAKLRRKRVDLENFDLLRSLSRDTFSPTAPDGISIPVPIAIVPELGMTLQTRVPGIPLSRSLFHPDAPSLALRSADALAKLHRSGLRTSRRHALADELETLRARLTGVAEQIPTLRPRILDVLEGCLRLADRLPLPDRDVLLHRDFYPDQVLVEDTRLWIVDLDLAAMGDPALDAGNFLAHLVELSLRTTGDARALSPVVRAFRDRFLARSDATGESLRSWFTLSLARHIALSQQFADRRHLTPALVGLCEDRLAVGRPVVADIAP